QYDTLCTTMSETLVLNFNIMNKYIVERDLAFNPYEDEKETERYFNFSNYDYTLYGRVFKDDKNTLTLEVTAYDRANQDNIISRQEKITNVFYIFEASDLLMEEVINVFSVQHLGFGSLSLSGGGETGRYQVLINGQNAGWNLKEIPRLLIGTHKITVRQERMLGEEILLEESVSIKEDTQTTLSFTLPYLTEAEAELLKSKEHFIKEKWNVLQQKEAFNKTFDELFSLTEDLSYCDRLIRKRIEYEMWKEIYDDQGEIPGVKKGVRLIRNSFALDLGYSYGIPAGKSRKIFDPFHEINLAAGYSLNFSWGVIALGARAGVSVQNTKETDKIMFPFQMISAPLGGYINYTTHFNSPFFAAAGLSSGVAVNSIQYNQPSTDRSDGNSIVPFLESSAGAGYFITRNFGLQILLKTRMIFSEDMTYTCLFPGFEIQIRL
ncbi:hypothetical protein, partial [Oceanispirochaeta sp.]|uniref:hypothetical protein n=1 Tax=Oceanispirochaeta sp. TaxID=2035350 RepID=UPI0026052D90